MDAFSLAGCFVMFALFVIVVVAGTAGVGMALRRAKNGLGGSGGRPAERPTDREGGWTGFRGDAPRGRSTSD
jgi:hypothetical protein